MERSTALSNPHQNNDSNAQKASLSSKPTLQLLHRATATWKLKATAPLFSFKKVPRKHLTPSASDRHNRGCKEWATIPAAGREQATRLYRGPTVRAAGAWDAPHDSPGPQAYNEDDKWLLRYRNQPSVRISLAKCERDFALPTTPGPGDYNISGISIEGRGNAVKFGDPAHQARYPPRTPDLPRGQVPCSFSDQVSCLQHQFTSDRVRAPTFFFNTTPRFQDSARRIGNPTKPNEFKWTTKYDALSPSPPSPPPKTQPTFKAPDTSTTAFAKIPSQASFPRRHRRRKKNRPSGGARIFKRGNYDYLRASLEPKQWEPTLNLGTTTATTTTNDDDGDHVKERRLSRSSVTFDSPKQRSLTAKQAPRAVMRSGVRRNPAEYNPQNRTLPRERDISPGPKYSRTPGAFGRTGGRGGVTSPSAAFSAFDRFPNGRLFEEEKISLRANTPGPEAYDVALNQRLEGVAFEEMISSLETMAACERSLGNLDTVERSFAANSGCHGEGGNERIVDGSSEIQEKRDCGDARNSTLVGAEEAETKTATDMTIEKGGDRPRCGNCARCSLLSMPGSLWRPDGKMQKQKQKQQFPCRDCLYDKASGAANAFLAAASSLHDPNLHRRARSTGASVTFGEMPRLCSAPAFSIGREGREVAARLLHTPGNMIYKEARLGRSGLGPSTASARAGYNATRPRSRAARVILPLTVTTAPSASVAERGEGMNRKKVVSAGDGKDVRGTDIHFVNSALGVQVMSNRTTSPSFTMAGPRRARELFSNSPVYGGRELSATERYPRRPFFDEHIPDAADVQETGVGGGAAKEIAGLPSSLP